MHAGLDGKLRRNDEYANRVKRSFSSSRLLGYFDRGSQTQPRVRRITVHEMNGHVKSKKKDANGTETKKHSLDPHLFVDSGALLGSVGSLSASEKTDRMRKKGGSTEDDVIKYFTFPFENLVFEGGGNKGMAYVGTLQVSYTVYLTCMVYV